MTSEHDQEQEAHNLVDCFRQKAVETKVEPEQIQRWTNILERVLEKDRGEIPLVPISAEINQQVQWTLKDLQEHTDSEWDTEQNIIEHFSERLKTVIVMQHRVDQLVSLLGTKEWVKSDVNNIDAHHSLEKLINSSTDQEITRAIELALDKQFGTEWRGVLSRKISICLALLYDNCQTYESEELCKLIAEREKSIHQSIRGNAGLDLNRTEQPVEDYLRRNTQVLYHGIGASLTSYLDKGILAPKTEEETVWGVQDIPLGYSSFGSTSRQAMHWTHDAPTLVVDCNKINRAKMCPSYPPPRHPQYEGDIRPEAIAGVIVSSKWHPCQTAFYVVHHAINKNNLDLLLPIMNEEIYCNIHWNGMTFAHVRHMLKRDDISLSWPKITLHNVVDAEILTKREE